MLPLLQLSLYPSRCEIMLIMVLLLDPNLIYLDINQQKQGLDEGLQKEGDIAPVCAARTYPLPMLGTSKPTKP